MCGIGELGWDSVERQPAEGIGEVPAVEGELQYRNPTFEFFNSLSLPLDQKKMYPRGFGRCSPPSHLAYYQMDSFL